MKYDNLVTWRTALSLRESMYPSNFGGLQSSIFGTVLALLTVKFYKGIFMKFKLIMILCSVSFSSLAYAQNVYNFYFEETSIGEVNSTNNADKSEAKKEEDIINSDGPILTSNVPVTTQQTSIPLAEVAQEDQLKRWEMGVSIFSNYNSGESLHYLYDSLEDDYYYDYSSPLYVDHEGVGINGAYRFNKYFSAEAALYIGTSYRDNVDIDVKHLSSNPLNASLGIAITPLHISNFGHEGIEISYVAGAVSYDHYTFDKYAGAGRPVDFDKSKKIGFYQGVQLAFNITSQIGIVTDYKANQTSDYTSIGLRYRF